MSFQTWNKTDKMTRLDKIDKKCAIAVCEFKVFM